MKFILITCEISGCHGSVYEGDHFLGCYAMRSGRNRMMNAVRISEMSVSSYQTSCNIPEDTHLLRHACYYNEFHIHDGNMSHILRIAIQLEHTYFIIFVDTIGLHLVVLSCIVRLLFLDHLQVHSRPTQNSFNGYKIMDMFSVLTVYK